MSPKEILLQGIEQAPKEMLQDLLDCFLKLKARYGPKASSAQASSNWPVQAPSRAALVAESQGFWAGKPLEQLRSRQKPMTVASLQDFAVDFWPEDESTDDFLSFLAEQRQAAVEG